MGICYCNNPDKDKEDGNLHDDHTVELKKKTTKNYRFYDHFSVSHKIYRIVSWINKFRIQGYC